jgi:hypothetical protein
VLLTALRVWIKRLMFAPNAVLGEQLRNARGVAYPYATSAYMEMFVWNVWKKRYWGSE